MPPSLATVRLPANEWQPTHDLGRHPGLQREGKPAAAARRDRLGHAPERRSQLEVVFIDDGSKDGSWEVDLRPGAALRLGARRASSGATSARRRRCRRGSRRRGATSSSPSTPTCRTTPPRSRASSRRSSRAARTRPARRRLRLEARSARPLAQGLAEPGLQPHGQLAHRRPPARPQLRHEGVPRRGLPRDPPLRRAAPLHPGPRGGARLPRRRDRDQPPAPALRRVQVRRAPLRQRLPRPLDRQVPHGLRPTAAARAWGRWGWSASCSAARGCCTSP